MTLAYLAALSALESGDDVGHRRKSASFNPGACPGLEVFQFSGREELTEICGQQCLRFEASSSIRLAPDETREFVQLVHHLVSDLLGDIDGLFQIGDVGYRLAIEYGTKINMKLARCCSVAFLEDFLRCLNLQSTGEFLVETQLEQSFEFFGASRRGGAEIVLRVTHQPTERPIR